jgi:hypothetical protein
MNEGCPRCVVPRKRWSLRSANVAMRHPIAAIFLRSTTSMCPIPLCSVLALVMALAACESTRLLVEAGIGPNPKLEQRTRVVRSRGRRRHLTGNPRARSLVGRPRLDRAPTQVAERLRSVRPPAHCGSHGEEEPPRPLDLLVVNAPHAKLSRHHSERAGQRHTH